MKLECMFNSTYLITHSWLSFGDKTDNGEVFEV